MRLPKHRLFDYTTPGKGVPKNAPKKKGIALFFDILGRRFWKMVSLNFVYLILAVPSVLIQFALTTVVSTLCFPALLDVLQEYFLVVCLLLAIIHFAIFGGGAVTTGMTKVVMKYRVDTHAWMWNDFKSGYVSKFKVSTLVYVINTVFMFLLTINFWFYGGLAQSNIICYLLQGLMLLIMFLFFLMQAYIYPIIVAYDKPLKEVYKCAFILAMGKFPIALMSMVLCLLLWCAVTFLALSVAIYFALLIPIIMFTLSSFINLFITYPTMEKYMGKFELY